MAKQKIYNIVVGDPSCDDCEICKAMAQAEKEGRELSLKELDEVFAKQDYINLIKKQGEYEN